MSPGSLPAPILVTRREDLLRLRDSLSREPILAVDTESNSLYAYQEQVCLIQFSIPSADFLVDPKALDDLSPLAPLFSNQKIEKVFHAAEYDLICLQRDFGFEFANLFDTMMAARILGRARVGLGTILEEEFGLQVDKRYQRANWGQRPLPSHLLDYARLDTHYLIRLRERLYADLDLRNLWSLAYEDFKRLANLQSISENGFTSPEERGLDIWRIQGARDLVPQQAAVLLELCRYRDAVASRMDRPHFKVVSDQALLIIALHTPTDTKTLRNLPRLSIRQVKRHGHKLVQAVQRGLESEPVYPPRSSRPEVGFLERLEALRQWRKKTAQRMGVPSDVVLPRDLLLTLADENPTGMEELSQTLRDVPWRLERFGEQILHVLGRH